MNPLTKIDYFIIWGFMALLVADLFFQILPIVPVACCVMVYCFLSSNRYENIFLLLYFYSFALGFILHSYGISGIGGLCVPLGLIILCWYIYTKQVEFFHFGSSSVPFLVLLLLFGISAFTTEGGDVALNKYTDTVYHGLTGLIMFTYLFSNLEKISTQRMGLFYLLYSFVLLRMCIPVNGIPGPSNLFDIGFLRNQTIALGLLEEKSFFIFYQNLGFYCVQGLGLYMINLREQKLSILLPIMFFALILTLYTGSRQAIITFFILAIVWSLLSDKNSIISKVMIPLFVIYVIYSLLQALTSEGNLLNSVYSEGYVQGGSRGPWLLAGIQQFLSHPIWGVGYGRYVIFGMYGSYPHNMFIELLCETGLIGFAVSITYAIRYLWSYRDVFPTILFLFIAIFSRAMVSDSLAYNIQNFALIFSLPALLEWHFFNNEEIEDIEEGLIEERNIVNEELYEI